MSDFNFQLSPRIQSLLDRAEVLNKKILSADITSGHYQPLLFNALTQRICYCLVFSDLPMTASEVSASIKSRLSDFSKKRQSTAAFEIQALFDAYEDIFWNYCASGKVIPPSFVTGLYGKLGEKATRTKILTRKLKRILSIQKRGEHPLVVAALLYIMIYNDTLFISKKMFAHLVFWTMLSAHGYTGNNLIVLEKIWQDDYNGYMYALKTAVDRENATVWIEYFVKSYIEANKKVLDLQKTQSTQWVRDSDSPESSELTERQSSIFSLFATKAKEITNRQVQKTFKTSQLTASRELAALVRLGVIKPHGKGRGTHYTRI